MRFYILDDLISSVKVLENIIESRDLGEVIGSSTNSEKAISEILAKAPDIVLVDLLMPVKDGITVVKEIREVNPDISFIMVSQVVDKNMISEAYNTGIEFFITKPNNRIEIENVIKRVIEKRQMASVLSGIRSVMGTPEQSGPSAREKQTDDYMSKIKKILASVGMLGESGTKDIINVCALLEKDGLDYDSKTTLNDYATSIGEDPKIVKQRIRRAVKRGLVNVASLGIEDYYNDSFNQYSHTLFNFDTVRSEMDLIRGKSPYGGKPSIDSFFEGLETLCDK
ncbi:MAG: DNA-binding domain-containing protein [Firmicutes bacterium]|nr:DNA-binding domain-containing protein [Bacillota bacterium]